MTFLRIAEQFSASDLGRQRQGNEDSFFVRAPLFVVADGMGGAQAGEVASRMAVEAFEPGLPPAPPGEGLVQRIEEANRRIHDCSQAEERRAGMGTTVTAAYVDEDAVVVAHVGDSRAYLLRGEELTRLTRDHSLVGELVARGKLTEEEAESHPQRSVITRALGPEASVEVDSDIYPAREGDVLLLCSDGLTSMIGEPALKAIITGESTLERAGRALIDAANEAGGRDNITVVLFRLEEVEPRAGAAAAGDTLTMDSAAVGAGDGREGAAPTATTTIEAGTRSGALPDRADPRPQQAVNRPAPRHRRRRTALRVLVGLAVVLTPILIGAWIAVQAVYFVGTDDRQAVTIYRGLPYELPGGIRLYQRYAGSGVTLAAVPPQRRRTFTDHKLRAKDDAEDLVIQLERGRLEP